MKNIHILPTDKPSYLYQIGNDLTLSVVNSTHQNNIGRYIYITSDEEIKEGFEQWYLDKVLNEPYNSGGAQYSSKQDVIILTTDQDLIKDGVQAIDDDFLEWFIKNPSCEEVEVKTRYLHYYKTGETFISLSKTPEFSSRNMQCIKIEPRCKIIIPEEEPKQTDEKEIR